MWNNTSIVSLHVKAEETLRNNNNKQTEGTPLPTSDNNAAQNDNVEERLTQTVGKVTVPNLKLFKLTELKSATQNFRANTVLGEGGFGRIFKGWVDETTYAPSEVGVEIAVVVKRLEYRYPQYANPHELQEYVVYICLSLFLFVTLNIPCVYLWDQHIIM